MHGKRLLPVLLLLLMVCAVPARAQEQPLVVFVLNPEIGAASVFDPGPDGITTLDMIFRGLGARTQAINLVERIPAAADVVVLVGPQQRLNLISLARLWVHLAQGKNLLLALEPVGYGGIQSEDFNSPLLRLITNAYGLITQDTFLVEPWFSKDSAALLSGTYLLAGPDVVPHPVVEPLIRYELPVQVWSARSLLVEPVGMDSVATPLLQTTSAYGETTQNVFSFEEGAPPLEPNIESDPMGLLNVAGLGENTRAGSRIAILGDAQMVQNGYGLANIPGETLPRQPGNFIFAERLAAWLLDMPEADWPQLPEGFSWLAVDGSGDDWPAGVAVTEEERDASLPANYDLEQVSAFANNAYLYVLAQPYSSPSTNARLEVTLGNGVVISAAAGQVTQGGETLADARLAVGDALELRLPLRVTGAAPQVTQVCLFDSSSSATEARDCSAGEIETLTVEGREPFDLRFGSGPLATIASIRDVALMAAPAGDAPQAATLNAGRVMSVVGRSANGDWLRVRSGGLDGWVLSSLVISNADINSLPVVQGN